MQRIIFLDFDGVIVPFIGGEPQDKEKAVASAGAVANLNRAIEMSGAEIVVSSHWKRFYPLVELRNILNGWGVKGRVVGITPNDHADDRGVEIFEWLTTANDDKVSFAIVDDIVDDLQRFRDHVVKTNPDNGITLVDVEKIVEVLFDIYGN